MAEKQQQTTKKQHYVPQFLLRHFAVPGSGKQIAVYRITDDHFIPQTSIMGQAHENHFYGFQQVEKGLSDLESKAASIIADILKNHALPQYLSDGYHILQTFTLLQAHRTRHAADERNEHADKFFKTLMKNDPHLQANHAEVLANLDLVSIKVDNAAAHSVGVAALQLHLANDLRCKVLHNRTRTPFVISDHPAVLYNQFLEERKPNGGITGMSAKGLQVFLPISPTYTVIFFDPWAYKVGGKRLTYTRVDVTDKSDINALNLLQAASAGQHIFSNGTFGAADMRRLMKKAMPYRASDKVQLREYVNPGSNGKDHLIHVHPSNLRLGLKLKCISVPTPAQRYEGDGTMLHVRNRDLYELTKRFNQAVKEKKYKLDEWNRFIQETTNLGSTQQTKPVPTPVLPT